MYDGGGVKQNNTIQRYEGYYRDVAMVVLWCDRSLWYGVGIIKVSPSPLPSSPVS